MIGQTLGLTTSIGVEARVACAGFPMSKNEKKTQKHRAPAERRCCEAPQADGSMRFHRMHQFWELADGLPVKKVRLSELEGFDEVRWFGGPHNILPTCRAIAEHARDIYEADLSYPSSLRQTDGCWMAGTACAKRFYWGLKNSTRFN